MLGWLTRTLAALHDRDFVTPELVMIAAEKVLAHRLGLCAASRCETPEEVMADVLRSVHPPV